MLPLLPPALLLAAAPQPAPVLIVPAQTASSPVAALAAPGAQPLPAQAAQPVEPGATGEGAAPAEAQPSAGDGSQALPPLEDPASPPEASGESEEHFRGDPLEKFNRAGFAVHQELDKAILRPVAMGYKHAVPKPVRAGIRNVLLNLTEPIVFINDLLQLRPGRAIRTLGRFVIDSTLGIGGVFDVAKRPEFNLPHHANGFGDTLGYYGVKPGPYLFVPLIGPTDVRDLLGGGADGAVLPLAVGRPFDRSEYQIPTGVIGGLDERAEADSDLRALFNSAVDPYATLRSVYLQDRAGQIRALKRHGDGRETNSPLDQQLSDPLAAPLADPSAAPAKADSSSPGLDDPLADPALPAQAAGSQN